MFGGKQKLDDRYFHENYVHHVLESGAVEHAVMALLDFRWIKLRFERLQMPELLRDYDAIILKSDEQRCKATHGSTDNKSEIEALSLISRVLKTALSRLWEHKDELAFQFVGRLRYGRDENASIEHLLDQIERLEGGQLLYTVNQCFETATSASQPVLDVGEAVKCVAVFHNENGWHIVAGTHYRRIHIYNGNDIRKSKTLIGHESAVRCLAVTSNGSLEISGSGDYTLRAWSSSTGECLRILRGHKATVWCVALARDGSLAVSGSADYSERLWNVETGECLRILRGQKGPVTAVSLTPSDDRIVSGSENEELFVWMLASGDCERKLGKGDGDIGSGVWSVAVLNSEDDAFIVSGHKNGAVGIWSIADGRRKYALKGHERGVTSVAVLSSRGHIVSASLDCTLRVWDLATGENLNVFHNTHSVFRIALVDDNRAVTSSLEGRVGLWGLESLDCDERNSDDNLGPAVTCSGVSKSGRCIVSGFEGGSVSIQDVDSGEVLQRYSRHRGVRSVEFIGEGHLVVSSSYDETVRVWNMSAEACERVFQSESEGEDVVEVVVAGDQRRIVMAFTNTILAWDVGSKDCSKVCSAAQEDPIHSIAVSDCGDTVVSGSHGNCQIRIGVSKDGIWSCRKVLQVYEERCSSLGITGDGAHVVSTSSYNKVRIWSSASGKCEKALDKHGRNVTKLAVTRGGSHVVLLSLHEEVYVWNIAHKICRKVNTNWSHYFDSDFVDWNCLVRHVSIFSDLLSECDDESIRDISKRASAATIKVDDKTLTVSPHDAGGKVMSATFDSKIQNVFVVDFKRGSGRIVLVAGRRLCILKVPDLPCSY